MAGEVSGLPADVQDRVGLGFAGQTALWQWQGSGFLELQNLP